MRASEAPAENTIKFLTMAGWVVIAIVFVALFASAVPQRLAELSVAATGPERAVHQLTTEQVRILQGLGITTHSYAVYNITFEIFQALVFVGVGLLIFLRQPTDQMARFMSLLLITMGAGYPATAAALRGTLPGRLLELNSALLVVLAYIFPNGHFAPRWGRWLALASLGYVLALAVTGQRLFSWPTPWHILGMIICFTPAAVVQIYRYRRISTQAERQQTKWVVYAMLVAFFAGVVLNGVLRLLLRALGNPAELHLAYNVVLAIPFLETIAPALIPVSIAFSIFKYRLWDIDLVINRSLVYGLVMVGLIASFALVAWGVQSALVSWLGLRQTWIPILVGVVLTAALFNPLYQTVQHLVDRRLYGFRFRLGDLNRPARLPDIQNPGMLTGYTLGGYQVLGLLGRGGMGEVYQGKGDGKQAAIKVLPIDLGADKLFRERLLREASALAALEHPNIVHFYESGEERNYLFLIMEFIAGQDLRSRLREHGAFSFEELVPIIKDVASAIDHIHAKGIIHRDLKPSNVMLRSPDGQPVLMDFGIARLQKSHSALTASGIIGTVDYMAPEQILTSSSVDYRVDIYALGVMLYELLTGERPFQGTTGQVLFGHLQQPPPDPTFLLPNLPAHVNKVIQRAMAKSPNDRYRSAHDLAKALAG